MATRNWNAVKDVDLEREYLMMVSYLPLKRVWKIPLVLRSTRRIQAQLSEAKGLIGYSLKVNFLRRRFWTLSAWEDGGALQEFVRLSPHSQVLIDLKPHMGKTKFVTWKLSGSTIPPSWEEAFRRLKG